MNARDAGRRLLVGLVSVALLAGCGAGASPTPATFGPVTLVTGTHQCPGGTWDWTTDPDGTLHLRDLAIECTDTTNDPRVSGTHIASANMDVWGTLDNGAGVQWASVRLENDGGAWEGRQLGVASLPGLGDTMEFWYTGTGGYEGLSYFALVTGSEPWKIRGQIFPRDPPPPYAEGGTTITRSEAGGPVAEDAVAVVTGSATCPGMPTSFDWTTDPDGTKHLRNDYHADRCTVTTDDPRASGSRTSTWNADVWGDMRQSRFGIFQWGTARLENDAGAWEGTFSGVASNPVRGDFIVNWYQGTGAYEGLGYFELWTGYEPWKIQGQIFPGDPPTP